MKAPIRILLGEKASAALTAAGADAFVVVGRASHPDDPTRWAIHLLLVPMNLACDAIAVATGEAKATRQRVTTSYQGTSNLVWSPNMKGIVISSYDGSGASGTTSPDSP